jgi:serine/threonine protein kinase
MARRLRPGDRVNGYTISELISSGGFAISYRARSIRGEDVFLKQYKMPSVITPWYHGYVAYQQELKRRIESGRVRNYCYQFLDFFEAEAGHPCYFQVFEFVSHGHDLQGILEKMTRSRTDVTWDQRMIFAKVLLAGVAALHEAKIVHCDLKPANVQLFQDPEIKAGYVLKLIDMDFSILVDRAVPWSADREFGYVGSPGYQSPEHLGGLAPTTASDVFTCALMLYELLAGGHPYPHDGDDAYAQQVRGHVAAVPRFEGDVGPGVDAAALASTLHGALSPDWRKRPSASDLCQAFLRGRKPAGTGQLLLLDSLGQVFLSARLRTAVGRAMCRAQGHVEEAVYYDEPQYFLVPVDGVWHVEPHTSSPNETLVNGAAIKAPSMLRDGDVLAVGRQARGIAKLPLTVKVS